MFTLSFPQVFMYIYFYKQLHGICQALEGVVTLVHLPLSKTLNLGRSTGAAEWSASEELDCTEPPPGVNVCSCTMNVKQGIVGKQQVHPFPKINKGKKNK